MIKWTLLTDDEGKAIAGNAFLQKELPISYEYCEATLFYHLFLGEVEVHKIFEKQSHPYVQNRLMQIAIERLGSYIDTLNNALKIEGESVQEEVAPKVKELAMGIPVDMDFVVEEMEALSKQISAILRRGKKGALSIPDANVLDDCVSSYRAFAYAKSELATGKTDVRIPWYCYMEDV